MGLTAASSNRPSFLLKGAAVGAGTGYGAGKGALIGAGVGAAAGAVYDITKHNN